MSNTMRLMTDKGNLFLKCYKPRANVVKPIPQNLPNIAFGHAVQKFLRRKEMPLPQLLTNRMGKTYTCVNAEIYFISEFAEGYDYEAVEPGAALRSAAELLGRFHQQLCGFRCPTEHQWESMKEQIFTGLTTDLERMSAIISKNVKHLVSQRQINQWKREVNELTGLLAANEENKWIIHGDYRAQNLRFDRYGRVTAILDLDTIRPASRLFDLAYALVFFAAVYQKRPLTPLQKSSFLSVYETVCPLSDTDRESLLPHLKLAFFRGIMLWLQLYEFGEMREKTRPWIRAYLDNEDTISEF